MDTTPPRKNTAGGNRTTTINTLAWRLLGLTVVSTPKVSFRFLETSIELNVNWFLVEVQYPLKMSFFIVADLLSSQRVFSRSLLQFCVDVILLKGSDLHK